MNLFIQNPLQDELFIQFRYMSSYSNYQYLLGVSYQSILSVAGILILDLDFRPE
jgi:hypothetical protein